MDYRGLPPLNVFFARSAREKGRSSSTLPPPVVDRPATYEAVPEVIAKPTPKLPYWAKAVLAVISIPVVGAVVYGGFQLYSNVRGFNPPAVREPVPVVTPFVPPQDGNVVVPNDAVAVDNPSVANPPRADNSYDFAKSVGLSDGEAGYLRDLYFDGNAEEFIAYFGSLPYYMRNIALQSGLVEEQISDGRITGGESAYFSKVIGSYQTEIEGMRKWVEEKQNTYQSLQKERPELEGLNFNLMDVSEGDWYEALATNLRNFRALDDINGSPVLSEGREMATLLPNALFLVDGAQRMYAAETKNPNRLLAVLPYASAMVSNVTENFAETRSKALEVAKNPDYRPVGFPPAELLHGEITGEAVVSTDGGYNAAEDIKLLLEKGSPVSRGALRLYARNITSDGGRGSAGQARVELTILDGWSIGMPVYEVTLAGHDVPAIQITDDDIALLKTRSPESLLVVDIDGKHYLPIQWTRKSTAIESVITVSNGTSVDEVEFRN